MKRSLIVIILVVILIILFLTVYVVHAYNDSMVISTIKQDDNCTIYIGGGCNSVVLTSEDKQKALIVDTKYFSGAKKLKEEVKSSDITIVNTHFHMDHARGNKLFPNAYVITGNTNWKLWDFDTDHSKRPDKIMNPNEELVLNIGNEKVHILDLGRAHSPNDIVVYFETRKLLIGGDLIWVNVHPMLADPSASVVLWLKYLDEIDKKFEIKTIVPGHGSVSNKNALLEMKEYFTSIKYAIGNKTKLNELRNKYKNYVTIPLISGFDNTANFIKKEQKNK